MRSLPLSLSAAALSSTALLVVVATALRAKNSRSSSYSCSAVVVLSQSTRTMGHDADAALPADESVPVRESSREDARVRLPLHLIAYIVAHSTK